MHCRNIAGTDLNVSILGFGNFIFGTNWWGEFSDEDGITLQNQSYDNGINFFDTGSGYGNGRAERLLGETIKYAGRDNLVISTKFGYDYYGDIREQGGQRERKQDFSPKFVQYDLEQSLSRLGIDCIDLYQAHNIKLPQYKDDLFELMERLKEQGKIRYWGVALGPAIGWREEGIKAFTDHNADTVQTVMNMYEHNPGRQFCEVAQQQGKGAVLVRVPTNSGILDEEFKDDTHKFESWDHRKFRDRNWLVYGLKKNEIIKPIANSLGLSIRQLAFKWLAHFPSVASIQPNLLNLNDIEQFKVACDGEPLPQDVVDKIDTLYAVDFHLGEEAHPCDGKSSITPTGAARSEYIKPVLA